MNMKYNIIITLTLLLSGCGLIPSKFDNVEYMHLVYLNLASDNQDGCNHIENESMVFYSKFLYTYSEHTTNENIHKTYGEILSLAQELAKRENPSDAYCNIKKKTIKDLTSKAIEVYGGREKE